MHMYKICVVPMISAEDVAWLRPVRAGEPPGGDLSTFLTKREIERVCNMIVRLIF